MRKTLRRRDERGYALALTALMLIPLMAICAASVDLGVWYLQASRNQRIADASALAGAVWLPDETAARYAALEAVRRNGVEPGVDANVQVDVIGRESVRVSVSTASEMAFADLFLPQFAITRAAVATHRPPAALGSPTNSLGSADLWMAISGPCSVRENGDLRNSLNQAGYPGGAYPPDCTAGIANVDYQGYYLYGITLDQAPANDVHVEVYDATYNPFAGKLIDSEFAQPSDFDTRFELYGADGAPLDITGRTFLGGLTAPSRDVAYDQVWSSIGTIPAGSPPGTYYLQVEAFDVGNLSTGSNGFALRAHYGFPFACSSIPTEADFSASCPQVHAVGDLSVYASVSAGQSEFYLAEIPRDDAGKTLQVSLFDVGEGAESVAVIAPDGTSVPFTWTTDCAVGLAPTPGCAGSSTATVVAGDTLHVLDVSGAGQQVYADTLSDSTWNDRTVVLHIDIPNSYVSSPGEWWKIRYQYGADITDRTTWSIDIVGDPVRLSG